MFYLSSYGGKKRGRRRLKFLYEPCIGVGVSGRESASSSSTELLLVYDDSVDSDPRLVVEGTGRDHFLDTLSPKEPVRSRPLPNVSMHAQCNHDD